MFLELDPRTLRLPPSLRFGADPAKLQRRIARFGRTIEGMPAIWVYRGSDGEFVIFDGVTRATRIAKLLPGIPARIEVIGDLGSPVGHYPTVGERLP